MKTTLAATYQRLDTTLTRFDAAMTSGISHLGLSAAAANPLLRPIDAAVIRAKVAWGGPHPYGFRDAVVPELRSVASSADEAIVAHALGRRATYWMSVLEAEHVAVAGAGPILAGLIAAMSYGSSTAKRAGDWYGIYAASIEAMDAGDALYQRPNVALEQELLKLPSEDRLAVAATLRPKFFDGDRPRNYGLYGSVAADLYAALQPAQPDASTRMARALQLSDDASATPSQDAIEGFAKLLPSPPWRRVLTVRMLEPALSHIARRTWSPLEVCLLARRAAHYVARAREKAIAGIRHELDYLCAIADAQPAATRTLAARLDGGAPPSSNGE